MLRLTVPAALHGDALTAELHAAGFPGAAVSVDGDALVIDGADENDRAAVQAVVDAHVPPPVPDPDADLATAINAVDTSKITDAATKAALDALKAALLGSGKPAAVSGRPTDR
jgi:hypothetical protein